MFGVDYAWGDPGVKALRANGVMFVCRYLSHDVGKNLRASEVLKLRKAGIDIVTVWESTASRALSGYKAGVEDAQAAKQQLAALDAPAEAPVYFAVDFDASEAEQAAINQYLKGCADVLGSHRVGLYAGYWPLKRAFDAKVIRYGWQTYAWSGLWVEARAHLMQYSNGHRLNGVSVDYNKALKDDFGQWPYPAKKQRSFYDWLAQYLGEGKYKGKAKTTKAQPGWWKRAADFLKRRSK